jgi:hypothetical protein
METNDLEIALILEQLLHDLEFSNTNLRRTVRAVGNVVTGA